MKNPQFNNEDGLLIPSVNEAQMREVDRIAVEDFSLGILQMMENAGRNMALKVMELLGNKPSKVITIAAGSGGNGGGGICSARHLYNHGFKVNLILSKSPNELVGAASSQYRIINGTGILIHTPENSEDIIRSSDLLIDALIGYSLKGAPRGIIAEYIDLINKHARQVLALDIPSGIDATTGETPGAFIQADRTLTLALPKPGLANPAAGEIYLADIGIPPEVFNAIGITCPQLFNDNYIFRLFKET